MHRAHLSDIARIAVPCDPGQILSVVAGEIGRVACVARYGRRIGPATPLIVIAEDGWVKVSRTECGHKVGGDEPCLLRLGEIHSRIGGQLFRLVLWGDHLDRDPGCSVSAQEADEVPGQHGVVRWQECPERRTWVVELIADLHPSRRAPRARENGHAAVDRTHRTQRRQDVRPVVSNREVDERRVRLARR